MSEAQARMKAFAEATKRLKLEEKQKRAAMMKKDAEEVPSTYCWEVQENPVAKPTYRLKDEREMVPI